MSGNLLAMLGKTEEAEEAIEKAREEAGDDVWVAPEAAGLEHSEAIIKAEAVMDVVASGNKTAEYLERQEVFRKFEDEAVMARNPALKARVQTVVEALNTEAAVLEAQAKELEFQADSMKAHSAQYQQVLDASARPQFPTSITAAANPSAVPSGSLAFRDDSELKQGRSFVGGIQLQPFQAKPTAPSETAPSFRNVKHGRSLVESNSNANSDSDSYEASDDEFFVDDADVDYTLQNVDETETPVNMSANLLELIGDYGRASEVRNAVRSVRWDRPVFSGLTNSQPLVPPGVLKLMKDYNRMASGRKAVSTAGPGLGARTFSDPNFGLDPYRAGSIAQG
uniref:Uncharacterized protein n=1 Tax=Phaeomonas parva TaxID=124430 RepID=A0A7S1UGI8_9STRA